MIEKRVLMLQDKPKCLVQLHSSFQSEVKTKENESIENVRFSFLFVLGSIVFRHGIRQWWRFDVSNSTRGEIQRTGRLVRRQNQDLRFFDRFFFSFYAAEIAIGLFFLHRKGIIYRWDEKWEKSLIFFSFSFLEIWNWIMFFWIKTVI